MPSPRLNDPSIPADGRRVVQDNTISDLFNTIAPSVAQVGQNYIGNEMEQRALADIQGSLQASKDALLQNTPAPMPAEAEGAISDYARRVANINSAVDQGAIGKDVATTRVNALTREYARRFPAFASEFTGRNSALEGQIEQAFAADQQLAAASRRAEEDASTRTLIKAHGFNPDDPAAAQLWMNLQQQSFIDAALEAKYKRDAATREQANEMAAHRVQLSVTSNILENMTSWLNGYDQVVNQGGPAAAEKYFTDRRIQMASLAAKWEAQIIQEVAPGPQQDRIISQMRGLMSNIQSAGSIQDLSQITAGIKDIVKNRAETGFMFSLSPAVRDIYAGFGANLGDVIRNVSEFISLEGQYRRRLGNEAYESTVRSMSEMLGMPLGARTTLPPDAPARIQEQTTEVAEGKARPSPQAAAAGRFLLDGGASLTNQQAVNAYNAVVDGGQRMPLSWFTRRDRIPKVALLESNPRFQRQVASEVAMTRQYFSRNPDARLIWRDEPDGSETWNIVENGRVLLSSKPPVTEQGTMISQAWPDSVRDTLNATWTLASQGHVFSDTDRLFSELNPVSNPVKPKTDSSQPRQ